MLIRDLFVSYGCLLDCFIRVICGNRLGDCSIRAFVTALLEYIDLLYAIS